MAPRSSSRTSLAALVCSEDGQGCSENGVSVSRFGVGADSHLHFNYRGRDRLDWTTYPRLFPQPAPFSRPYLSAHFEEGFGSTEAGRAWTPGLGQESPKKMNPESSTEKPFYRDADSDNPGQTLGKPHLSLGQGWEVVGGGAGGAWITWIITSSCIFLL